MVNLGDRLRHLMLKDGRERTPAELRALLAPLKECGADVSYQAVKKWSEGDVKELNSKSAAAIAQHFKVNIWWLITGKGGIQSTSGPVKATDALNWLASTMSEMHPLDRDLIRTSVLYLMDHCTDKDDVAATVKKIEGLADQSGKQPRAA